MSLADQMSLAEVKNRLSEVVDHVERERGRVVITKHGRRAAVVMSLDDLESLEETLEVLADQPLLQQVRKSMAELTAGKASVLTKDEALAVLRHK
jgi:prevent-host-death family protein